MLSTLYSILPIFLLITTGFLTKKFFINQENFWESIDKLVYYLFFPCLLILEINKANFSYAVFKGIITTLSSTVIIAIIIFISKPMIKDNRLFTSVFQGGIRYNSYIFIALSASLFGNDGVALSGVFIAYMIVIINILSVTVLNFYGSNNTKSFSNIPISLLKNPLIIAVSVGFIFRLVNVSFEGFIKVFLAYLGASASPLSLMSVGAGLLLTMEKKVFLSIIYAISLKLVLMPLLTLAFLYLFNISGSVAGIALLYSCVPCAGNAYILSRQMGGDSKAMASIITWGTLASIITIPLFFNGLTL